MFHGLHAATDPLLDVTFFLSSNIYSQERNSDPSIYVLATFYSPAVFVRVSQVLIHDNRPELWTQPVLAEIFLHGGLELLLPMEHVSREKLRETKPCRRKYRRNRQFAELSLFNYLISPLRCYARPHP